MVCVSIKSAKKHFQFYITIHYPLPMRQNLARWGISTTSDCSYCLAPETLLHVVAGCQSYLERFTWRHDSVLNFLATNLRTVSGSCLYADLPGYNNPSIVTGDCFRPDLLATVIFKWMFIYRRTNCWVWVHAILKRMLNGKTKNMLNLFWNKATISKKLNLSMFRLAVLEFSQKNARLSWTCLLM